MRLMWMIESSGNDNEHKNQDSDNHANGDLVEPRVTEAHPDVGEQEKTVEQDAASDTLVPATSGGQAQATDEQDEATDG